MGVLTKRDHEKDVIHRFARLVAKGFTQRQGIDYEDVFAPVTKYSTVRFFFALTAQGDLEMIQLDVKKAFLNGDLEEEIYVEQPKGFLNHD